MVVLFSSEDDNVYERVYGTVELIMIVMSGVVVHSVYKPPNDQFVLQANWYHKLYFGAKGFKQMAPPVREHTHI